VAGGGKIFHGSFNEKSAFTEYFGAEKNARPAPSAIRSPRRSGGKENLSWGPIDGGDEATGDAELVDWAVKTLNTPRDQPLFLAVGFRKPHLSWFVPKKYFDLHPVDGIQLPPTKDEDLADVPPIGKRFAINNNDHESIVSSGLYKEAVQAYLAAISFHDAQLGRLLDAIDRHPRGAETIIVYWSDHGWHLGEKEHWRKFTLWERATRVPLIISAPGITQPGSVSEKTVDLLTLYPTLIELSGLPAKADLREPSLVPLLRDPAAPWPHPAITTYTRGNHSVRKDHWRYIEYSDGTQELYDHRHDPNEWTNLAQGSEHAAVLAELKSYVPKVNAPDAASNAEPGRKKRLKARTGEGESSR
jgi:arylsulfatase A-like enzyme